YGQRAAPTSGQEQKLGCFVHFARVILYETSRNDLTFRFAQSWSPICEVTLSADYTRHGSRRFSYTRITRPGLLDPAPVGHCQGAPPGSQTDYTAQIEPNRPATRA